ncbi:hypothetical protein [Phenylobacterium sp.]|uniref:hypothetical protein n=1 Tax=Phenylobacterium sp. TaxID=1871053 RepID=UPI00122647DC|nr:hypothetical protein [Phenylobacterium sp.]THD71259.1 MAG: hypothetical protein E8A12_01860 [Phenylobacterium sp.]
MTAESPLSAPAPHRRIVGVGFQVLGGVLGVPSLVCAVGLSINALALRHLAAPHATHFYDIGTYGLAGMIANGGRLVDKGLGFLAGAAGWISVLLAAGLFAVTVYSALLFAVGRGISRRADWARIVGAILSLGFLAIAMTLAAAPVPADARLVASLIAALPLYVLWTLIWRFRPTPD